MATMSFSKIDIAIEYLDTAMQMYLDRHNLFCAIHLAAAAAELLDKHLPKDKRILDLTWNAQKACHWLETGKTPSNKEINDVLHGSKNAIKHMDDGELTVTVDPIFEAEWYIEQALTICFYLKLPKSNTQWRFEDYQNKKARDKIMAAPTTPSHSSHG